MSSDALLWMLHTPIMGKHPYTTKHKVHANHLEGIAVGAYGYHGWEVGKKQPPEGNISYLFYTPPTSKLFDT